MPYPGGLDYIFHDKNTDSAEISISLKDGHAKLHIEKETEYSNVTITSKTSEDISSQSGVWTNCSLKMKSIFKPNSSETKQVEIDVVVFQSAMNEITNNVKLANLIPSLEIKGAYFSGGTIILPQENADRFSRLKKSNRINDIINCLKEITPSLSGLELYFETGLPILYAKLQDDSQVQVAMMGSGFQSLLSILLIIASTDNGVVLLDEIDSAIHYSKLSFFWKSISEFSYKYNCQIMAVTHSRECVSHAVNGFRESGKTNDLSYFRIETDNNETKCIRYTADELSDAIDSSWEIR